MDDTHDNFPELETDRHSSPLKLIRFSPTHPYIPVERRTTKLMTLVTRSALYYTHHYVADLFALQFSFVVMH